MRRTSPCTRLTDRPTAACDAGQGSALACKALDAVEVCPSHGGAEDLRSGLRRPIGYPVSIERQIDMKRSSGSVSSSGGGWSRSSNA